MVQIDHIFFGHQLMGIWVDCIITFVSISYVRGAFQVVIVVKNLPAKSGDIRDVGSIPGSGRSPRRGHGNHHSSISAWRILWPEEPGRVQSMGSQSQTPGHPRVPGAAGRLSALPSCPPALFWQLASISCQGAFGLYFWALEKDPRPRLNIVSCPGYIMTQTSECLPSTPGPPQHG